jgi:dihydroorotase
MTLYLTDNTPPDEIARAKDAGVVAVKLYPAGATTNSDAGVTDLRKTYATLEAMQRLGLPLLVHGEVTDPESTCSTARRSSSSAAEPLRRDFPALKVVFEHITTREAAQYVARPGRTLAATITAHHLLYNRNASSSAACARTTTACRCSSARSTADALVEGGHLGQPKFFLGTDSAPHPAHLKEHASGCAGCYTARGAGAVRRGLRRRRRARPAGSLRQLPRPDFYGLPRNTGTRHAAPRALGPETRALRRRRPQTSARRRNARVATGLKGRP